MKDAVENKKIISKLIRYAYEKKNINAKLLKTRKRHVVDTNIALVKCIKSNISLTLKETGSFFNKSHATIVHYINQHEILFKTDSNYVEDYKDYNNFIEDYKIKNVKNKKTFKKDLSIYLIKMNKLREENKLLTNELNAYKEENKIIKEKVNKLSKFANW